MHQGRQALITLKRSQRRTERTEQRANPKQFACELAEQMQRDGIMLQRRGEAVKRQRPSDPGRTSAEISLVPAHRDTKDQQQNAHQTGAVEPEKSEMRSST